MSSINLMKHPQLKLTSETLKVYRRVEVRRARALQLTKNLTSTMTADEIIERTIQVNMPKASLVVVFGEQKAEEIFLDSVRALISSFRCSIVERR